MHEAPLQALLPALEGIAVEIRNVVEGQGNKKLFQLHRTGWPTCGLPRSLVHHSRTPHIIVAQLLSFIPSPLGSANQFAEGALQKVYFGTSNRRFMARADDHFGGHERLGLVGHCHSSLEVGSVNGLALQRALSFAVMFYLQCTSNLLDRIKPDISVPGQSDTALGNWYATVLFWKPQVALLVSERTLLPVPMPLAPAATLARRFPGRSRSS